MEIYKRFVIKTLILMLVVPVLLTIIALCMSNYFIGKGIIKYGESQIVHQWTVQKNQAVRVLSKRGPMIVFVSGSNSLFGVNAKMIEEKTGIPTLNYASHAGLSTYIFYNAKRILKPKDIVFLPLEYDFYNDNYEINSLPSTLIEYTIAYDNDYYRELRIKSKLKILMYLVRLNSIMAIGKTTKSEYKLSSRGDMINANGTEQDFAKTAKTQEIIVNKLSDNYQKWELYKFIQWCKLNDIKVYAFAPNIYHKATATEKEKESFKQIEKFYKLAGVPFIGKFEDGFYDFKYMYNTIYHLNTEGQKRRSKYFIDKIQYLAKSNSF